MTQTTFSIPITIHTKMCIVNQEQSCVVLFEIQNKKIVAFQMLAKKWPLHASSNKAREPNNINGSASQVSLSCGLRLRNQ